MPKYIEEFLAALEEAAEVGIAETRCWCPADNSGIIVVGLQELAFTTEEESVVCTFAKNSRVILPLTCGERIGGILKTGAGKGKDFVRLTNQIRLEIRKVCG